MTHRLRLDFDGTAKNLVGFDMSRQAARQVYDQSGLGPEHFQVIELHDCFSANELLTYEALGLARGPRAASSSTTTTPPTRALVVKPSAA